MTLPDLAGAQATRATRAPVPSAGLPTRAALEGDQRSSLVKSCRLLTSLSPPPPTRARTNLTPEMGRQFPELPFQPGAGGRSPIAPAGVAARPADRHARGPDPPAEQVRLAPVSNSWSARAPGASNPKTPGGSRRGAIGARREIRRAQ